jgi:hypothetical protein
MNPKIEIHSAEALPSERKQELIGWFEKEFGQIPFQWADPDWYVLALSGSRLIGRVGIVQRKVFVSGGLIEIAGISGVVTDIEWRRTGIASDMLQAAAAFVSNQLKINFCLLLCRSEVAPVYKKLGWKIIGGPTIFDQPSGKAVYPRLTMILEAGEKPWPKGPVDLCGLPW